MRLNDLYPEIPYIRWNFRRILVQNPNYFGNFPEAGQEPIEKVAGNTTYEAINCIGLNSLSDTWNRIEATVAIKLPGGYGGSLCSAGTTEYVRFFIDYGDGKGFQNLGLGSFTAHDIPNANDCRKVPEKPLYYTASCDFSPIQNLCFSPNLPVIRGILSWNVVPPLNPDWTPVWGNVVDQHIQIRPRIWYLKDFVHLISGDALSKLPSWLPSVGPIPIPLPDPAPVEFTTLALKYGKTVPSHRFGFPALAKVLNQSSSQQELVSLRNSWSEIELNIDDALKELQDLNGNTDYEELDCLGLEDNFPPRLVATFKVKLSSGYSGGLCQSGSTEYVAFWADWDDTCQWTYLGTVGTIVHDIPYIPKDGLSYSAVIPVNLFDIQRSCEQPKISRIRAVLSWYTPPSTINPDEVPFYGNILDAHVQIPPSLLGDIPQIVVVGFVDINLINTDAAAGTGMTVPNGKFFNGDPIGAKSCPFGGRIDILGPAPSTPSMWYRILVRKDGDTSSGVPLTAGFFVQGWIPGPPKPIKPDPITGWTPYSTYAENFGGLLQRWDTSSLGNGLWNFQLETAISPSAGTWIIDGPATPWYRILLDNHAPNCSLKPISIPSCGDITVGDTLTGQFSVSDDEGHLRYWNLEVMPSGGNPINPINPSSGDYTASDQKWTLETVMNDPSNPSAPPTVMVPCGYTVWLQAWDLTITNSQAENRGNYNSATQGFCLRAPPKNNSGWDECEEVDV